MLKHIKTKEYLFDYDEDCKYLFVTINKPVERRVKKLVTYIPLWECIANNFKNANTIEIWNSRDIMLVRLTIENGYVNTCEVLNYILSKSDRLLIIDRYEEIVSDRLINKM